MTLTAERPAERDTTKCRECGAALTRENYSPCNCDVHFGLCGNCAWRTLS